MAGTVDAPCLAHRWRRSTTPNPQDMGVSRRWAWVACCTALAALGCEEAQSVEVQPLPPLQRPSPERRAGLPEVRGTWRFAGFEYSVNDTAAIRDQIYLLVPPGELRIAAQRMDSLAGQYVRDSVAFPFFGEVRRDSVLALVAFGPDGSSQFATGRVMRDTLWLELTSFPSAQRWPPETRAALVRGAVTRPFRRLRGYDAAAAARLDSLRRADEAAEREMAAEPATRPQPQRPREETRNEPVYEPPPRPRIEVPRDEPEDTPVPPPPRQRPAPRDTFRLP